MVVKAALVKGDVPQIVNQCEKVYIVSFGGQQQEEEEMKGVLRHDMGRIQRQLTRNYNACRARVRRPQLLDRSFPCLPPFGHHNLTS